MDKHKIVGKRWMSALLALILMMTLLPAPSAAADDSPNGENAIQNPGFENPPIDKTYLYMPQEKVSAWETTAKEGVIEFGRNLGSQTAPHYTSTDKSNAEGQQFAELNADEESTLYQNVTTVGGNVYEWGLQHRGRIGVDKMALIIGPTQENAPSKPSKNGRDQYMQLTDWVHANQAELEFTIPDNGCSQRLTVYSKPFGANGTFLGGSGSESPFSTEVSNIYTERWDVWIIATDNQRWVGYGIKDNAYQGDKGVGGGLSYKCSYLVPDGQTQTTFAFCSYSSTAPADSGVPKTYGNLIDDLQFSLYHTVTISATPGSSKITASTKINGKTQELDFSQNGGSIVVRNNNDLTLTVWENKNALSNELDTEFAGALVIGPNGSTFYPVGNPENMWKKVEEEDAFGQKHYGFTLNVSDPVSIRLIFVQSPAVTYFANGGAYEAESGNTSGVVSFKGTVDGSGVHARPPYTSHAATGQYGWQFDGWLSVRDNLLLPAIHTVSYNYNSESPAFTFSGSGMSGTKVVSHGGVTLVAQWSYRQRAQVQLRGEDGAFANNDEAGTVTITSAAETNDAAVGRGSDECYAKTGATVTATATAKEGYYFLGWAVEGSDEYVSTKPTYTYHVSGQETRTVYARFAKQYAVTYEWAAHDWTLTGDKQPALPDDNIVLQGDSYAISTKYSAGDSIKDTVSGVPGHWAFNGWKDQKATDGGYLTGSIPNVNRDYVLVGDWKWVPNSEYQLSYSGGDDRTCWIPTETSKVPDSSHYQDSNVTVAGALTTTCGKVMLSGELELEGTWSFTGWKRSDTGGIVPAGQSITMPGHNLELTAQWEFTPKTYTVQYDLAGGTGTALDGHTTFDYSRYTNGKTGVVEKNGIPFGAGITLRDFTGTPPADTYFAGWSLTNTSAMTEEQKDSIQTQGAGAEVNSRMLGVTEDDKEVTLYAVYRSIGKITVEFDVNDPNMGSVTTKSGVFTVVGGSVTGDPLTSVATANPGYQFTGWTVEVGPDRNDASFGSLGAASLTIASTNFNAADAGKRFVFEAQFAPNGFTVKFDKDAEDATGAMNDQPFTFSAAHEESLSLNPNQFHRPGYAFKGWSEYPAAERSQHPDSPTYPDCFKFAAVHTYQGHLIEHGNTVTLYAVWEALPNITIRYETFGSGTVTLNQTDAQPTSFAEETGNPETGTFVGATAAPAEGWEFDSWYLDTTKVGTDLKFVPEKASGLYQAATYVAHFVQKTYRVTFNTNATDATGEMEPQTFTHGEGKALTANAFVRPGYSFLGWATTEDGPVAYTNQQVVSIVENTTLYAVWCEDKVTLFYDTADAAMGTVSRESETVNAVTTKKASGATAAANAGYRFIGWYSEMGDKLSDNASFAPQKPNGEQPEDSIWKTAHYIARFERVGDPKPIDPVKPGGDDSKDSYYFAIEKIDAQDSHALNGATFALYQYSSDGKTVNRTTATTSRNGSESGIALFSVDNKNSYEGIWYYAEVTAPEGYVLDSTEHKITKNDFSTSQSAAIRNAETVRNYRSSTPNMLNDTDHFAYVIGYKDGLVKPYGLITRAETTAIFFRLLKDSVRDSSLLTSSTYTDVPDNYWANTAISTMTGLGIVQGRSTTTFDPQSPITRAQFAAICARFDTGTSSGTQTFSDISGHWAEKYIQRAAELGWIKGFEDGTFRPDTYITRAQAMTMINRVLNRIPEEESDLLTGMNVWPDCNPGDWFYLAVQEATNSHAFKHKAGNYETWIGMSQNPDWTRYEN